MVRAWQILLRVASFFPQKFNTSSQDIRKRQVSFNHLKKRIQATIVTTKISITCVHLSVKITVNGIICRYSRLINKRTSMELVSLFNVDWDASLLHSGNEGNDRSGLEEKDRKPLRSPSRFAVDYSQSSSAVGAAASNAVNIDHVRTVHTSSPNVERISSKFHPSS
jgi:hypothetical protein